MTSTRKHKPKADLTSIERRATELWDAQSRMYRDQERAKVASETYRRSEAQYAEAARVAANCSGPYQDTCRRWLVWWWNNGDSSPRGDRPCITDWSDLPAA